MSYTVSNSGSVVGNGEFVTVKASTTLPNPSGNYNVIVDNINDFKSLVERYNNELDTAISNIEHIISTNPPASIDIPEIGLFQSPASNIPEKPTFSDLELSEIPDSSLSDPVMMPIGDVEFDFVAPIVPDEISSNFDWSGENYSSEMWSALFSRVHQDILTGGTGLSQTVYNAIVSREQEARRKNQDRSYRSAIDGAGATGFNLPSGHIAAVQVEVAAEIIAKDQEAMNTLMIKDFDLATENTKFSVSNGVELERMLRATWESVQSRGLEAEKAAADYIMQVYDVNIKRYIASWDGVKIKLEALKTKVDAISSANDSTVKVYLGKAGVYETTVKAISAKNDSLVSVRKSEVDIYGVEVDAAVKKFSGDLSALSAAIEVDKTRVMAAIEESKVSIQEFSDRTKLAADASVSIGNIKAQTIASTLGAINTSLSQGYSSSDSASESWSHGNSISEGHSYEEL